MHKPLLKAILTAFVPAVSLYVGNVSLAADIVVSASRSTTVPISNASNIVVISRDEILNSGATSLPELLRGQPGIAVSDLYGDGSNATIDMRGFGESASANTLVMIDGRKINFASDTGSLYFNAIDLDNVEQIEIVQGSAGILFGNMAVGGAINVITRKPAGDTAEAGLTLGSFNSHSEKLRVEKILQMGWSVRGLFTNRESDNFRDHNEAETQSASLLLQKQLKGGRLFVEYEKLDDYIQTPGSLFLDELATDRKQAAMVYQADYQDLVSDTFRLGLSNQLSDSWSLEIDASLQEDEREFITTFRAFPPGTRSTQDRQTVDFNPRLIGNFGQYQVTVGLDMQNTDYLLVSAFGPQAVDQLITGIYAQSVITLDKQVELVAGLRHARIENDINDGGTYYQLDDDVTIGSLAANYHMNDMWRLYARADQNYRFAKVDEHTNPVFMQPVGLENQTGITYELGAQFTNSNAQGGFQIYQLDLDDEISFDASGYSNINLDETRRLGFSVNGQWFLQEDWVVGMNYDYVDTEITSGPFDGNNLPQVPENRIRLFGEYTVNENLNLVLNAIYSDNQMYGGDYNNLYQPMKSYTVVNFSGMYEQENWSLSWRVNNLLDKQYSDSGSIGNDAANHVNCLADGFGGFNCPAEFPAPERNFWLSLMVKI